MAVIEGQDKGEVNLPLENQEQEVYFNFINSLKSPYTKESYDLNIKLYLKFCNLDKLSELLAIEELEKKDSDIALELKKGNRVKIVEDSEHNIDILEYPSDSNY